MMKKSLERLTTAGRAPQFVHLWGRPSDAEISAYIENKPDAAGPGVCAHAGRPGRPPQAEGLPH